MFSHKRRNESLVESRPETNHLCWKCELNHLYWQGESYHSCCQGEIKSRYAFTAIKEYRLNIEVAVDTCLLNFMDPTWNVEINLFDGGLARKKQFYAKSMKAHAYLMDG